MKKQLLAAFVIPLGISGCVNPTSSTVKASRALPTYTAPASVQKSAAVQKDPDAYRSNDPGRAYSLTLKNADLRDVLMLLSKESGVSIVAERGLRGTVQIEAKNRKLGELLYTILKPLGYTASVENGMILVGRPRLATRTFRMNYLKDTRNSTSNMSVSGFAAGSTGSVSVSTAGRSDLWGAVENSLEMLVFGTSGMGRRSDGGYIRGESERKQVAESVTTGATQLTSRSSSQNKTVRTGYDETNSTSLQTTEIDDPMQNNTQIKENQLKQLVVNEIAGIIQITDFPENLDKIASFLTDVEEGSKRQVLIQAHIMEVSLKDSFAMGIDWRTIIDKSSGFSIAQALLPTSSGTATAGSNVFKISGNGSDFGVMLDAMKEQGNINMLSSPKITALNNQKAVIKLTTKEVSWVSTKTTSTTLSGSDTFTTTPQVDEVGIFLDVTPQIGQDGSIIMQIHPSVSEIREISTSPDKTSTKPVIDVREIDTMVDARAGETIVIAGLISDKLLEAKRGVPILGDIPYLGALFSYNKQTRTKAELVIMMTPYFLNAKTIDEIRREHEKRLQNIGGDFHLINNLGSMITEKSSRDWIMRSEPHRAQPTGDAEESPTHKISTPTLPVQPRSAPSVTPAVPAPSGSSAGPLPDAGITAKQSQGNSEVPHNSTQQLERQKTEIETLTKDVAVAGEQLKRARQENVQRQDTERQSDRNMSTVNQTPILQEKALIEDNSAVAGVRTISKTTDREQTLYNNAVSAYKTGACAESIKKFDSFTKAYPNSPFKGDAAHYRKDCEERLSVPATQ